MTTTRDLSESLFYPISGQSDITSYFNEARKNKKVIAIFAMGGGNDTFSAIHLGKYLKEYHDFSIIFFAVLGFTPYHTNSEVKEELVDEEKVILSTTNFKRYLMTKKLHPISSNEKEIPGILTQEGLGDCRYYLYSSKYQPEVIAQSVKEKIDLELERLGMNENDLLILASDYGGDVLGHDMSTYSPDLDAFSARMIQAIKYSPTVSKLSLILWPGVDGELSNQTLLNRFEELNPAIMAKSNVNHESSSFEALKRIYDKIKAFRLGNTIPNAIKMLTRSGVAELKKTLASRADKKYVVQEVKQLDITEDLVRMSVLLPLAAIISINPFAQIEDQQDLLSFFIKIMQVYKKIELERLIQREENLENKAYPDQARTDFHMQYLRLSDKGWTSRNTQGKLAMQILISPLSFNEEQACLLLEGGVKNLEDESIDIALSSVQQLKHFQERHPEITEKVQSVVANHYALLWKKEVENPEIIKQVDILKDQIIQLEKPHARM